MPLPDRNFNEEIEKTRGVGRVVEIAARTVLQCDLITDKDDYRVAGLMMSIEALADRLDDLCHMWDEERAAIDQRLYGNGAASRT